MKHRSALTTLILDWLLIVPGVLGSVFCLTTAFDLPTSIELLYVALGSIAIFSICLGHKKQDRLTVPLLLAALLIPAYLFRVELIESFRNLWGVLSSTYAKGYHFFVDYIPKESTTKETVGTALLFLTVLEAFLCCLAVRVWKRTTPAALALLICIGPCYVLTDTPPDTPPLLFAIFSVLTQAFSQSARRRETGERGKAIWVAALLSVLVLVLLNLLFPQDTYSPPISWDELAQKMDHWKQEWDNQGNVKAGLTGNPSTVDLSNLGSLPNSPYPVFSVVSSEDSYLYLCGSSYTGFDGTIWSQDNTETWAENVFFPYLGPTGSATLTVETIEPEPLLYTTYYLTQMPEGGIPVSDAYLRNDTQIKHYSMQFTPDVPSAIPDPRYDKWVREHCLELPEQTASGVLTWWQKQSASRSRVPNGSDPAAMQEFVETVAKKVSECASYSRNPVQPPEEVDFCTWFLNDATEGYCVHYASSCTALLRALGIPSRYVSGYVCDVKANQSTRVTNLQAHAWVEVWIDGHWTRVEATPTEATEFTGTITQTSEPLPLESFVEPTEFNRPNRPSETREPVRPTRPSESASTEPLDPKSGNGPNTGNPLSKNHTDLTLLYVFLGIICVPLLFAWRRRLKQKLWERRYANATPNEQALLLFRKMRRLEKVGGGSIPEEAVALAQKAKFSQYTLDDKELRDMQQVCKTQCSRLTVMSLRKRIYCKYVLALY